ncbi:MAG: replication initiator protein A [Staphylococcus sp.]|uniref:replication initiator protein A n=1 Tax=Staphylococcus sp. TaxID=29387 RepID=UPI0017A82E17|nr:replication initiator protein A [Staphylococcus sp.]NWN86768.1 replication initiator protein A [Staphylococcus sp.]
MTNFKKISASEYETQRFYQLPKFLFEDEYFSKMSTDAKVMYSLLKDRFELSRSNNWIDKSNNIYLLYTNKQLCSILQYAEPKIIKLKKELEKYNLILNERQGLNKPNRIYLLEPSYDKELIKSKFQNKEIVSSRTNKNSVQELTKTKPNDTELNDTDISDIDSSDTNDMNDIREENIESTKPNHPNHTDHLQKQSDEEALKHLELQEMPEDTKRYMNNFSTKEIQIIKSVILKAKRSFNDMYDEMYMLEDMDQELHTVLKRVKGMMVKKQEKLEAMQGYLMRSILSELEEMRSTNMRRKNFENSPLNMFNH